VQQWTGREHKEMQRLFVGIIAGAVPADVVKAACAAIDFIYYAQLCSHTELTLTAMEKCLRDFHTYKAVFVRLGICEHFNIPKIHSMVHYVAMIRLLGSADGYNTEASERLHINYAKDAYQASNCKDYVKQMTTWLQRQEVADQFSAYLSWRREQSTASLSEVQSDQMEEEDIVDMVDDATPTNALYVEATSKDSDQNRPSMQSPPLTYKIAKAPAVRNVSVDEIVSKYGARDFLPKLTSYLKSTSSGIVSQALSID
jgi:hypothetical protein